MAGQRLQSKSDAPDFPLDQASLSTPNEYGISGTPTSTKSICLGSCLNFPIPYSLSGGNIAPKGATIDFLEDGNNAYFFVYKAHYRYRVYVFVIIKPMVRVQL